MDVMIEMYVRYSEVSIVSYLGCDVLISFMFAEFTRVFDIPGKGHKNELRARKVSHILGAYVLW